jgi:hypothetical protein
MQAAEIFANGQPHELPAVVLEGCVPSQLREVV